ncbi:coiled-coil domain-containing protein 134 [Lasius niger]|uniref:Coiled-coil domain-containing protein 134 n=1 Tax=Lasius niger TaxID=67767 RepID=A0A0J7KZT6_LASNI|nr:coiled-coil domain-containing protein 134 [Lasius niger]
MDNYERLYKMITVLAEKVVEVIESSKNVIEKAGFVPNNSSFPKDTNVKDEREIFVAALSSVLENTALFGDIILHLPDITHRILKTQQEWSPTIHWSLNFTNQMRHLLNKSTITMIRLVEQELNITERDPSYFNPYRSAIHVGYQHEDTVKKKKKPVKKEKRKKGPQIAKIEL